MFEEEGVDWKSKDLQLHGDRNIWKLGLSGKYG